jgi:shikimate dehydrogenase
MLHLGLIGYPLGHSFSPKLHEAALKAMGIPGSYSLFPIPPGEVEYQQLTELCAMLREGRINGLNVTIPHKRTLLTMVDGLTPTAKAVGAVNTLFMDGEQLWADNTDVPGFLVDLAQQARWPSAVPEGIEKPVAWILGAGGSARAVSYSLARAGWFVVVIARQLAQAHELVDALSGFVDSHLLSAQQLTREKLSEHIGGPILIVNTTPLGMHPNVHTSPWPEGESFPRNAFVYDLVYNPQATVFVRTALGAGNRGCTGLGMLIEQAALSLERWAGREAPRDAMWKAAQASLRMTL